MVTRCSLIVMVAVRERCSSKTHVFGDIVWVGGVPQVLLLALALRGTGLNVKHFEHQLAWEDEREGRTHMSCFANNCLFGYL